MKVSLNTIKEYVPITIPLEELVAKINKQLGKVEMITDLGKRYEGAVIVRVVECARHPDADRLSVCKIDDGGTVEGVERDDNGLVQVVCGAPNVHADMLVVWLPPGSTVPSSYDEKELFVLEARELRGVVSNGMLASAKELAIGNSHDGILEIDPADLIPSGTEIKPGDSFARAYDLDDIIIDIENKMFTHRPDLFGQLGVARELFAILHPEVPADTHSETRFEEPGWYWDIPQFNDGSGLSLTVFNDIPSVAPRFMAVALRDVTVGPSPLWLQTTLVRWGSKPINNVVDLTNYLMLLTAQPTHAYDYDKLRGQSLGVRMARAGESVKLLNDKTYELTTDDIVIVDGEGPVGLAGIMGGGDSEVDEQTTNVVLEVANFDMYTVRKSSMRHGLFTDALTRFNKGQSPLQNDRVLLKLVEMMAQYANSQQASDVFDVPKTADDDEKTSVHGAIRFETDFVNTRLGLDLTSQYIGNVLRLVNFAGYQPEDGSETTVETTAPFWRTDIALAEDIVEEVGRLYGFDRLPRELPGRSTKPSAKNPARELKQRIRESLSRSGANEALTYSFVHEKVMQRAGQQSSDAFALSNALSPDLQYYRHSVLPSLLDKVHMNSKAGYDEFVLFEIGKGHNKNHIDPDGLPTELEFVDGVYASKKAHPGAAFYMIRRYVDRLAGDLGIGTLVYKPIDDALDFPVTAPFELPRSASVETSDGRFIGIIGELKQRVMEEFKLPVYSAAFSLDLNGLLDVTSSGRPNYIALPRYPRVYQDISLEVAQETHAQDVLSLSYETVKNIDIGEVNFTLNLHDIYQAEDSSVKTLTFRLGIASHERTLKEAEVSDILEAIATAAKHSFSAVKK